jgi:hypothetical protein
MEKMLACYFNIVFYLVSWCAKEALEYLEVPSTVCVSTSKQLMLKNNPRQVADLEEEPAWSWSFNWENACLHDAVDVEE